MQNSFGAQLLLWMESLWVVLGMTLVVIVIRMLWLASRKKAEGKVAPPRSKDYVLEIIDTLLIALILVFGIVRPFLLQTFFIPSGSMEPNLLIGDKLIANKFVLRFRQPLPGEVIVFQPPLPAIEGNDPRYQYQLRRWLSENPGKLTVPELRILVSNLTPREFLQQNPNMLQIDDAQRYTDYLLALLPVPPAQPDAFIKRTIGVPGDHIKVDMDKGIFVNGKLIAEPYLPRTEVVDGVRKPYPHADMSFPQPVYDPGSMPRLAELRATIGDRMPADQIDNLYYTTFLPWVGAWYRYHYLYLACIAPHVDNKTREFVVPPHSVFAMGDNRHAGGSFDSRYWGVVPFSQIKARAVSTFWPLNRLKLL